VVDVVPAEAAVPVVFVVFVVSVVDVVTVVSVVVDVMPHAATETSIITQRTRESSFFMMWFLS
jgi:hypothetical protein